MRIDRTKLNTLLRSGLNADIKTRKQLAAHLQLDPTSLTRWFSSRDRLGNPRLPVVPDRHVSKILQLFNLEPHCLSFNDEQFRQHCFETALQRAGEDNTGSKPRALSRIEKVALRRLTIPHHAIKKTSKLSLLLVIVIVLGAVTWQLIKVSDSEQGPLALSEPAVQRTDCWTGYSETLGKFDREDSADPCHYSKLLDNALEQLKTSNISNQLSPSTAIGGSAEDYLLFLSKKLDQRRAGEKISLNFELGRNELGRRNYPEALQYLQTANKISFSSPEPDPDTVATISAYIAIAVYSDKPWRYARQSYEQYLLTDTLWNSRWSNTAEIAQAGQQWRSLAQSELEDGNLVLALSHIETAMQEDSNNLGDMHFTLASNWLVMGRIMILQGDLPTALNYIEKAIALDSKLFGAHHPRVAQNRMVLTLLALREGHITEARQSYQLVSGFFQELMGMDHPGSEMDHWLTMGLNQLAEAGLLEDENARKSALKTGWENVNKAFSGDNPFIPRRYAVQVSKEAMRLQHL